MVTVSPMMDKVKWREIMDLAKLQATQNSIFKEFKMHKSIQNILDRNATKNVEDPIKDTWIKITEFFDEGHEACDRCEWNWGEQGCRLLHSSGPNNPGFCKAFDEMGDK